MSIKFEIHYNENPFGVVFAGQIVKGRAIIHLNQPMSVLAVRIQVRGYARVIWDDDESMDEEKYFKQTVECIETRGSELTLESGTHTYNFEYNLPLECPSSFEGTFGRIRYDTRITLVRSLMFNKSYSAGFNVVTVYDLNRFPQLSIPAAMEVIKEFCCCPCKSSPLILTGFVQKTGFVPGEFIIVNVKLINHSSIAVNQIRISLNIIALYTLSRNKKVKRTEKISISKRKFEVAGRSLMEIKDEIQIPPTVSSSEGFSKIINITYEVEVTAKVNAAHKNPVLSIPITIGNIPFVTGSSVNLSADNLEENLEKSSGPLSILEYCDAPLSYKEAVYVQKLRSKVRNDRKDISEKFVPKYPIYNISAPNSSTTP